LGPDIENLVLTGSEMINGMGHAGANSLTGNDSHNVLAGLGGADTLDGGLGRDTADYSASPAAVSVNLATGTGTGGDAQGDILLNMENVLGSGFADVLIGDGAGNTIIGGAGIDILVGGLGDDRLIGGANADWFFGADGADQFMFVNLAEFGSGFPLDLIWDFDSAQADKIALGLLDADLNAAGDQAFTFLGAGGFTAHAGELNYILIPGVLLVRGDVTGDGAADFSFGVLGVAALTATDFVL
jgi:Ca2+-binding RTX toxin-like protein